MSEVVWRPARTHACERPPVADHAVGTIVKCEQGHYSQVRERHEQGIVPSEWKFWYRLNSIEVSVFRFFGMIP